MRNLLAIFFIIIVLTSCVTMEDHLLNIESEYSGSSGSISDGLSLIQYAAAYGSGSEMEAVLSLNGPGDINQTDQRGNTPAVLAVLHNNYETFEVLVEMGCDLSFANEIGGSAITYIGYFDSQNRSKAFSLLKENNELLQYTSSRGMTLPHYAAYGLNAEMLRSLITLGCPLDVKENMTGLTPIDMTQLSTYKYTDLIELNEDDYSRENFTVNLLLENESPEISDLPMNLSIYGNFLFVIYATIDSLFPYKVDLGYVNKPDYFTIEEDHGREVISLNQNEIIKIFNFFSFDIEIDVYDSDFKTVIQTCSESEDLYVLIANFGNHPYMNQHWACIRNITEDGSYTDYLEVMNPNALFEDQYFKVQDISQLVAVKLVEINS